MPWWLQIILQTLGTVAVSAGLLKLYISYRFEKQLQKEVERYKHDLQKEMIGEQFKQTSRQNIYPKLYESLRRLHRFTVLSGTFVIDRKPLPADVCAKMREELDKALEAYNLASIYLSKDVESIARQILHKVFDLGFDIGPINKAEWVATEEGIGENCTEILIAMRKELIPA